MIKIAGSRLVAGRSSQRRAYTLIEMLIVITIIGLLAAVGLPAMKGLGESGRISSANRQLLDDIAFARQKAISTRSHVFMVFIPPSIVQSAFSATVPSLQLQERKAVTNLFVGQYTSYALFSRRNVGDQPGHENPRYIGPWKSLPDGLFIEPAKYAYVTESTRAGLLYSDLTRPFAYKRFPFPLGNSPEFPDPGLPYLEFNSKGQLVSEPRYGVSGQVIGYYDAVVALSRGSIFYSRDANGEPIPANPDLVETPRGNSTNNYNRVRIDWLTGRPSLEQPKLK
jgi:prepilin-type N-terminal cleavage/methylation domain-containing protein